jgi:hypothetical protein
MELLEISMNLIKLLKNQYMKNQAELTYDAAFEQALEMYAKNNTKDALYNILYKEKLNSDEIMNYMENGNFEYFFHCVNSEIYGKAKNSQINVDFTETDDTKKNIANFTMHLLYSLVYNTTTHSAAANKLIENLEITATYKKVSIMEITPTSNETVKHKLRAIVNKTIDEYAAIFEQPLFLHKNLNSYENPVILKDIFVHPKFKIIGRTDIDSHITLNDFISQFTKGTLINGAGTVSIDTLVILGHAGIGKSSLISKLMYHYRKQDDVCQKLFDDKQVICIRLRDFSPKWIENGDVLSSISEYLHINDSSFLSNKIIIMDGFDELCMMSSISKNFIQNLSEFIRNMNSKLIITSRPGYNNENYKLKEVCTIELEFFDKDKRTEWFDKYLSISNDKISDIKNSICESDDDIFGLPLIIYISATNKLNVNNYKNKWGLFKDLFSNNIYKRGYDKIHNTDTYSKQIYRIIAEIAFYMYKKNIFYINKLEIDNIIENLYNTESKILISNLKDCYAINTYFKNNYEIGVVEFCHNEIRDFFTCEAIGFKLSKFIDDDTSEEQIIKNFQEWFGDNCLNNIVINFLYEKLSVECCNLSSFLKDEMKLSKFKKIYNYMLDNGFLYKYETVYPQTNSKNIFETMYNVFFAVYSLYHSLYINIDKYSVIEILSENKIAFLSNISTRNLLDGLPVINLSNTNLNGANLSGAYLSKTNLNNANLIGADLIRTNLSKANLSKANLSEANLIEADLSGANLSGAKLIGADLSGANLSGTKFVETDLNSAMITKHMYEICDFTNAFNVEKIQII